MSNRFRPFLALLMTLAFLFTAHVASAAGRIEWKSKELKEREGGSWRLEVAIYMPRAPDVPHVPMKFEFQPTAYYERDMLDGDKLVERTVPLENRQALIESVDVGFLDSGSGKIESRTRFTFNVTRAHGYEAGEYKVTIRDGRNGQTIGTPVTLQFKGENEVIDRRAMVFTGDKKKKKKEDSDSKGDESKSGDEKSSDKAASSDSAGESKSADDTDSAKKDSDGSASEGSDEAGGNEPEPIKKKPGGCGCRLESTRTTDATSLVLVAAGAAIAYSRRRTRGR